MRLTGTKPAEGDLEVGQGRRAVPRRGRSRCRRSALGDGLGRPGGRRRRRHVRMRARSHTCFVGVSPGNTLSALQRITTRPAACTQAGMCSCGTLGSWSFPPAPPSFGPGLYACELVGLGSGVPVGGRACPQPCLHPGVRVCNPTGGRVIVHACVQAVPRTPPLCARVVLCPRRHVRMRTATSRPRRLLDEVPAFPELPSLRQRGRALVYATRHVRMGRLPAEGRVNLCSCTQLSRQEAVVPCGARAGEWRERGERSSLRGSRPRTRPPSLQPVVRSARWPTGTWRPTAGCDGARTVTGVGACTISPARFEVARFAQDTCDIPAGEGRPRS